MRSKPSTQKNTNARAVKKQIPGATTSSKSGLAPIPHAWEAALSRPGLPSHYEADFAVLADGSLLEIVQGETGAAGPRLLMWDGERGQIAHSFTRGAKMYMPVRLDRTVAGAMRLPPGIADYGSTRKLFEGIAALVARVRVLPHNAVALLTYFFFADWFSDLLPVAPVLWLIAPATVWCEPLVQLVGLFSRRSLYISELTTAALHALPTQLRPTLITEAATISPSFIKALRVSHRKGAYAAAGSKVRDLFCPKVVFAHQPLVDSTTVFPLEVALFPTRERVPLLEAAVAEQIAAEFQAKLCRYRVENYRRVTIPDLDLREFTPPVQELAQNLASCVVGDQELQRRIVSLLRDRDQEVRVDQAASLESIVIEAALGVCHLSPAQTVPVGDLTKKVNTILKGRGELLEMSPETVGWKLRALGLHTQFITGGAKGLALPKAIRARIHNLAAAYGVRSLVDGPASAKCEQCVEVVRSGAPRRAVS